MNTVLCRPEMNALTVPPSYTLRYIARNTLGYDELAEEMARDNPLWDKKMIKEVLMERDRTIMRQLINGNQVTLENAFSYRLSFNARLNGPDDPLPPAEKMLRVKVSASRTFVKETAQQVQIERLPEEEKLPVISSAEDTAFNLNNVLNPDGVLRLTGSNLDFDRTALDCGCVIEGTRSGRAVQTQFASISNSEVLLVPHIPAQNDPWNNEYTLSLSTRYTEHGTLRTGICRRKLRSPLTLSKFGHPNPPEVGILTGSATAPYVTVTGSSLTADTTLRIQAVLDPADNRLRFSLLDMNENGAKGDAVMVSADGQYTLPGFASSAVSSLNITVNNYAALTEMIKSSYAGWLADVLVVKMD
jgi:hypothetical protein